jgi:carotenoid isomerooxygenase
VFERAKVVGSVSARWGLHPSYMHTFGVTENYFVIVEQPLSVSVPALVRNTLQNEPMIASLRWYPEEMVIKKYILCLIKTIRLNDNCI